MARDQIILKGKIESILFVAEKPVSLKELALLTGAMITDVQQTMKELIDEYSKKGIRIIRKGEYFHFVSAPENSETIAKYLNEELRHDLSEAALETLAIITYKQPVTRMEIEEIRGVNCEALIRNLMIRGLITEVGRKEAIGRPILYGTTMEFLQYLGLENENQLPKIEETVEIREKLSIGE
ncbi:MAG: SMC-Scp complex subunit ScpB [Patescibacteria group bacterium]|nr:SMC-Scp complex subunit ScpB [Patescibacteria group bacterium]